jgi:hypothetical protein
MSGGRCSSIRRLISKRLAEADQRLQELQEFKNMLQATLRSCEQATAGESDCPVVSGIGTGARPSTPAPVAQSRHA